MKGFWARGEASMMLKAFVHFQTKEGPPKVDELRQKTGSMVAMTNPYLWSLGGRGADRSTITWIHHHCLPGGLPGRSTAVYLMVYLDPPLFTR